ncbi:MAG TPA: type II toxin-antitoxin system VapC family toxin [Thermoanaerobaculia bacterium]|nr:type II toxin-antitoxin system VapC family toxin [Thermoanaerobaculia bacterium]
MELIAAIGAGPVAIDTPIFIYWIEQHPRYLPLLRPLFQLVDSGEIPAVTSALTLLETLVIPYRAGERELAEKYEAILTNGRGLTLIPIHLPVIRLAARIRATTSLRTPDALQLATAALTNCTTFLTNDARLRGIGGIEVLHLDAFVPSA